MQISIRKHVGECFLLCFCTIFKGWHHLKGLVGENGEKEISNNNAILCLLVAHRTNLKFLRKESLWYLSAQHCCTARGGGGGRLVSSGLDMDCPPGKALLWLAPLSSLSSPLQLARWQLHVEGRDNQLPSPLFSLCPLHIVPVSLSHFVPRPFLSITLNATPFFLFFLLFFLTISPFIPCLASLCVLITHPLSLSPYLSSLCFTAACLQSGWRREKQREHVIQTGRHPPASLSRHTEQNHC